MRERDTVLTRAGGLCELCGGYRASNIHHRRPRGMGGTKAQWINEPSNLLALCGSGTMGCHGMIESNRAEAYDRGWLLRTGSVAEHTPFMDLEGDWWLLVGSKKHPIVFPNPSITIIMPGVGSSEAPREEKSDYRY